MDPGRDRRDGRVHVPVVGLLLVVEHHRNDQHDDVALAGRGDRIGGRPQPAALRHAARTASPRPGSSVTCERPSLIAATTASWTSTASHLPAVRRELRSQRQAHLAGPDDRNPPGRARLAPPRARPTEPAHGGRGWAAVSIEPPSMDGADARARVVVVIRQALRE